MYKRAVVVLALGSILFVVGCFGDKKPADEKVMMNGMGVAAVAVSNPRVVECTILKQKYAYELSEGDIEVLCRIVEAEAGCEDEDGKLLVANVVLNRMNHEVFPDSVKDVVFQMENGVYQFSPIADGRYYLVEISESTVKAVERALFGEDLSQGALYFMAREHANPDKVKWFDESLCFLFIYGGHEFFK